MRWWGKAHRLSQCLLVACILPSMIALSVSETLEIPTMAGSPAVVPYALLLPLALSAALAWSVDTAATDVEATATRRTTYAGVSYVLVVSIVAAMELVAYGVLMGSPLLVGAARNVLAYSGLLLFGRITAPKYGPAILPPAFAFVSLLLGPGADGTVRSWTWVVASPQDRWSWIFGLAPLLGSTTLFVARPHLWYWEHRD